MKKVLCVILLLLMTLQLPLSAAAAEPVVTDPIVTEPIATEPIDTEPVVTEPVVTEPVVTEPVVTSQRSPPNLRNPSRNPGRTKHTRPISPAIPTAASVPIKLSAVPSWQ